MPDIHLIEIGDYGIQQFSQLFGGRIIIRVGNQRVEIDWISICSKRFTKATYLSHKRDCAFFFCCEQDTEMGSAHLHCCIKRLVADFTLTLALLIFSWMNDIPHTERQGDDATDCGTDGTNYSPNNACIHSNRILAQALSATSNGSELKSKLARQTAMRNTRYLESRLHPRWKNGINPSWGGGHLRLRVRPLVHSLTWIPGFPGSPGVRRSATRLRSSPGHRREEPRSAFRDKNHGNIDPASQGGQR